MTPGLAPSLMLDLAAVTLTDRRRGMRLRADRAATRRDQSTSLGTPTR